MLKPYRLVVFDWEGTLGDTLGQIINSVATQAKRLNFGELNEELARQSVELGLVMAVKRAFPHLSDEQHDMLLQAVNLSLAARTADVYLIPGARAFVKRLDEAGVFLAVASNKGLQSLQRVLHACELDNYFKVIRAAGQVAPKPAPDMLIEILDEFNVTASEALMIGDSTNDMEMAKSIGVDAIGVDFYHQQETQLKNAGAMAVFDDYKKLAEFLKLPID